jgi:hypothetical protein
MALNAASTAKANRNDFKPMYGCITVVFGRCEGLQLRCTTGVPFLRDWCGVRVSG